MPKQFFKRQLVHLYFIIVLTLALFITEGVFTFITHSLVLRMDCYYMLCNILALSGRVIAIKKNSIKMDTHIKELLPNENSQVLTTQQTKIKNSTKTDQLINTFGWARIETLSLLVFYIFLTSLSFHLFTQSINTLRDPNHLHDPLPVLLVGTASMLLNAVCYLLIGGFINQTCLQSSNVSDKSSAHQKISKVLRSVASCAIVVIYGSTAYLVDGDIVKYVDPLLTLVSATSLVLLYSSIAKQSSLIFLQAIPDSINMEVLKTELQKKFPYIVDIHDFHVWQLTATKIFSTVHLILEDPGIYEQMITDVKHFFLGVGIAEVTIQVEFCPGEGRTKERLCLVPCPGGQCVANASCETEKKFERYRELVTIEDGEIRTSSRQLESIKIISDEFLKVMQQMAEAKNVPDSNPQLISER